MRAASVLVAAECLAFAQAAVVVALRRSASAATGVEAQQSLLLPRPPSDEAL